MLQTTKRLFWYVNLRLASSFAIGSAGKVDEPGVFSENPQLHFFCGPFTENVKVKDNPDSDRVGETR
jgi:hypothetical protein